MRKLIIDPSKTFLPEAFVGPGATIWRGPIDGKGLDGDEEIDGRSLALPEVDLLAVVFHHCLKVEAKEQFILGDEKLKRLKEQEQMIRLGGEVFLALLEDWERHRINSHLEWFRANRGILQMDFPGTVCRSGWGEPLILNLFCSPSGWDWGFRRLRFESWGIDDVSAGLWAA